MFENDYFMFLSHREMMKREVYYTNYYSDNKFYYSNNLVERTYKVSTNGFN